MKIVNVTLVVSTDSEGRTTETQAVDPNFTRGLTYAIPELGEGLWTVTEVGEPATNFVGGKTISTTRVTVTPAAEGSTPAPAFVPSGKSNVGVPTHLTRRPVQKPTQKTRHTPK